jgi:uncharacterized Zn-binding protein involved in type VI secretion
MPGVTRDTLPGADIAGGPIVRGSPDVFVNLRAAVRIGDPVQSHPPGGPHARAIMTEGAKTVLVNGIGVCRSGDLASCLHPATGSNNVFAADNTSGGGGSSEGSFTLEPGQGVIDGSPDNRA